MISHSNLKGLRLPQLITDPLEFSTSELDFSASELDFSASELGLRMLCKINFLSKWQLGIAMDRMSADKFQMLPSPPDSQRGTRADRRKLNSSEESTASTEPSGIIPIDVTASEFRLGIPAPLRALPLITDYVNSDAPVSRAYQPIKYNIYAILRGLNISYSTVDLVQRWEPGQSPNAGDVTILIMAEQSQHWQAALNDIQRLIMRNNLPFMRLEIMNEKAHLSFFLPRSHPAFKDKWNTSIRARVLDTLGLTGQWRSLTILNRGHTQDTSVPTVTIELSETADQLWQQVVYQDILEILEGYSGLVDKHVAFVRPSSLTTVDRGPPPAALPVDAFRGRVPMGSSIGIGPSSGTIGGYVKLERGGQVWTMGLTNHHVIENDTMTANEKANGLAPKLSRLDNINAPSSADRVASVQGFEDLRNEIRTTLYGPLVDKDNPSSPRREESGMAFKIQYGDPGRAFRERYDSLIGEERSLSDAINQVRMAEINFGSVFASSGNGRYYGSLEAHQIPKAKNNIKTGNAINWALIHVSDQARIGGNLIAQDLNFDRSFQALGTTITEAQLTDVQPGTKLFKKGRNGTSMGIVSEYTVELSIKDRLYRAAVVMPANVSRKEEFLYGGDSGSFCMNNVGTFCALGFAGHSQTGAGYVIPASWIYADIFAKTGARVVDPEIL